MPECLKTTDQLTCHYTFVNNGSYDNKRLMTLLENRVSVVTYQRGFKKRRIMLNAALRVADNESSSKYRVSSCGGSLDIAKAYDMIWKEGLLLKRIWRESVQLGYRIFRFKNYANEDMVCMPLLWKIIYYIINYISVNLSVDMEITFCR